MRLQFNWSCDNGYPLRFSLYPLLFLDIILAWSAILCLCWLNLADYTQTAIILFLHSLFTELLKNNCEMILCCHLWFIFTVNVSELSRSTFVPKIKIVNIYRILNRYPMLDIKGLSSSHDTYICNPSVALIWIWIYHCSWVIRCSYTRHRSWILSMRLR